VKSFWMASLTAALILMISARANLRPGFAQGQPSVAELPVPSVSLPPELARVLTDYENAWSRRNPRALAQLFVEDGLVLSPGSPMIRGREAIERFYAGDGAPLSLRAVAFAMHGDVGYIIGAYSERAGGPDRGKFTLTLRQDRSKRWLIVSDMDNGNARPPTPGTPRPAFYSPPNPSPAGPAETFPGFGRLS
jgi:ketosteroid isomerase-like protein